MMYEGLPLSEIDKRILQVLKNNMRAMSTYELAKEGKFSWSSANVHCYKLKSMGLIEGYTEEICLGKIRNLWKLKSDVSYQA